jgi:fibrillarin-like rRNA methylase
MKKTVALLMTLMILVAVAAPTFAQGRSRRTYRQPEQTSRVYNDQRVYNDSSRVYYDYSYRDRSFWDRHRDKLTLAIGAGSGAAIGGLIGGKRGAVIGAASGLGASALYTYKIRNRRYRY